MILKKGKIKLQTKKKPFHTKGEVQWTVIVTKREK